MHDLILNENDFANAELTTALFYLSHNKIICKNDYDTYSYYDCESPSFFLFGEVMEQLYNKSYDDLTQKEIAEVKEIERLNTLVERYNLAVICISPKLNNDVIIIHKSNTQTYFLINFELLEKDIFNGTHLDFLLHCNPNTIENPYHLTLADNKLSIK